MIKSLVWTAGALLLAGWGSARGAEGAFWEQDVWRQPDRPFLYYGMQPGTRAKKSDTQTDPENDIQTDTPASTLSVDAEKRARQKLESIATLTELQAEVKARLEAAVMQPTPEAIALYLQANAFLLEKASTFAEGWKRVLMNFPQYDHTATHPVVNAASTDIARKSDAAREEKLQGMKDDWGLVFFADASDLTRLMAPVVKDFAARWNLETVWVTQVADNPVLKALDVEAVDDATLAARTGRGITMFPSLVLVHRKDRGLRDARLVATGVAAATDLVRRITLLAQELPNGTEQRERTHTTEGRLARVRLQ